MLHSSSITNRIWTQEPVYRDSHLGNLGKTRIVEMRISPLQDGFDGNCQTCLSVAIDNHTTSPAGEQSIVSFAVSVPYCTAVRAPLGSVVSVNFMQEDRGLLGVGIEELEETVVWNPVNLLPSVFSNLTVFSSTDAQLLNRNGSIIGLGEAHDFLCNLSASGLNKVSLIVLEPFEGLLRTVRASIGKILEFASSFGKSGLSNRNVPSEVKLLADLAGNGIENGYSRKSGRTHIRPDNKSFVFGWLGKFLFQHNGNPSVFEQGNIVENPAVGEEGMESSKLVISSNWYHNRFSWGIRNLETGIPTIGLNISKPSLVEPDGAISNIDSGIVIPFENGLEFPSVFSCFFDNIRGKIGGISYA